MLRSTRYLVGPEIHRPHERSEKLRIFLPVLVADRTGRNKAAIGRELKKVERIREQSMMP